MIEKTYTQKEILQLIKNYDETDRKIITINLSTIYKVLGIKSKDVIADFNYSSYKVHSWTALSSPNIPTFEDALALAVKYNFDIRELIKPI